MQPYAGALREEELPHDCPTVHAENFVGCRPAILFASATWSRESEPKYVCA